jgi:microcin C transport system permease protein
LFFPTLIGATAVIFMVMALAPISIVDVLLPPGGDLLPGQRAVREQYIQERYGLNKPAYVQYLRWLNNISPVGFCTWTRDDPEVVSAREEEARQRKNKEQELTATGVTASVASEQARKIDLRPDAGDIRLSKPAIKSPDLGNSFIQSRPAWDRIKEALPITIILQLVSLPLALMIAILSGIRAARFRGQLQDKSISVILLAAYSIPVIWIGVMLIGFLANVQYLKWFPAGGLHSLRSDEFNFLPSFSGSFQRGYLLDTLWHLVLPVVCISYGTVAFYSKLTRTALLEVLSSDFVRTARAKGLPEGVVTYRHAFRNSLLPLITVAAGFLPRLVTGSIVVESIFGINGMGRLVIDSLKANDRELFLSASVIILVLQLVGNLLADLLYVVADPRVSYDK